jgi:hypothetical protein
MSVVIGMNFGFHTLIAADTRVTTYANGKATPVDGYGKIARIHAGLVAGAGQVMLVEAVKKRLNDPELTRMAHFIGAIRNERQKQEAGLPLDADPRVVQSFDEAAWMLSMIGVADAGHSEMRIAIAARWAHEEFLIIPPGHAYLLFPPGIADDVQEDLHDRLNAAMCPMPEGISSAEAFTDHLAENLDVVGDFIEEIAALSDTVSTSFQAAVQTVDLDVGISGIYGESGGAAWTWTHRGNPAGG